MLPVSEKPIFENEHIKVFKIRSSLIDTWQILNKKTGEMFILAGEEPNWEEYKFPSIEEEEENG